MRDINEKFINLIFVKVAMRKDLLEKFQKCERSKFWDKNSKMLLHKFSHKFHGESSLFILITFKVIILLSGMEEVVKNCEFLNKIPLASGQP